MTRYAAMELGYPMPAHKSTARTRLVVIASVALATLGLHAMSAAGRSSARESSWTLSALLRSVQDGFRRTEGGPAASALLDVHAIAYGASLFPADAMFVDGDPAVSVRFGWLCYAVRYGREPWILVDAGFNDAPLARDFSLTEHVDPLKLLEEKLGLRAADVGTLIVTHHHFDHAGNVHRFPNAAVHMHAEVAETLRLPENAWDCPGALDSPQRRDCGPNHPKGTERLGSNGSSHWVPGRHASSLPERLAAAGLLRTFEGRWSDPIPLGSDPNGHYLRIEHPNPYPHHSTFTLTLSLTLTRTRTHTQTQTPTLIRPLPAHRARRRPRTRLMHGVAACTFRWRRHALAQWRHGHAPPRRRHGHGHGRGHQHGHGHQRGAAAGACLLRGAAAALLRGAAERAGAARR